MLLLSHSLGIPFRAREDLRLSLPILRHEEQYILDRVTLPLAVTRLAMLRAHSPRASYPSLTSLARSTPILPNASGGEHEQCKQRGQA
jgi:hypothetical protein